MKSIKELLPQKFVDINPDFDSNWGKIVIKRGLFGKYTISVFKGTMLFRIDSKVFETSTWFSKTFIELLKRVSKEFPSLKIDVNLIIRIFNLNKYDRI